MSGRRARAAMCAIAGLLLAGVLPAPVAAAAPPPPYALGLDTGGEDGRGRIQAPGLPCGEGGLGAYWHSDHHVSLAPDVFLSLPAEAHLLLEVHSDIVRRPNSVDLPPPGPPVQPPTAFLPPGESRVVLANQRGTIELGFGAGSCELPAVLFDGRTAAGEAPWTSITGSGAYQTIAGAGSIAFSADVDPGADNPWNMSLAGELSVDQPELSAAVDGVFWGSLGVDYVTRRASVRYRITNTGTGSAFDVRLAATGSPTPGVTALGPHAITLPDLHPEESTVVTVRYQLGLLAPCGLVILGCDFLTGVTVTWADALDRASSTNTTGLAVSAPALPPLLP